MKAARSFVKLNISLYRKVLGLALIVVCLSSIGTGFALLQNSVLTTVEDMSRAQAALAHASRCELTFIEQRDSCYADSAHIRLAAASTILQSYTGSTEVDTLLQSFSLHSTLFSSVEQKLRERGLDENSGSEGALRQSVHSIEGIVKQAKMDQLQVLMLSMRRSEKDFFLREKDKYIEKVEQETSKLIAQTQASRLPDTLQQHIVNLADNYLRDFHQAATHIKQVSSLSDSLMANSVAIGSRIESIVQTGKHRARDWQTIMIAAIALSICTSVILAVRMSGSITKPVKELQKAAGKVAEGNLDMTLLVRSNDELGHLAGTFNTMVEKLRQSEEEKHLYLVSCIEELLHAMDNFSKGDLTVHLNADTTSEVGRLYEGFNTAVDSMRTTLQHVVHTITTTASASAKITSATEQLSKDAIQQKEQTLQVALTVEKMAASSAANARTSGRAAELARQYRTTAEEGEIVIRHTMDKIGSIAEVVHTSVHTINNLNSASTRINEIIDVINEIADQTNLLALNAAIEAARAGAHGRGFSVVADEVGKLAVRTAAATKSISAMIRDIQSEADTAVRGMQYGEAEVTEGLALADKAGTALAHIMATSDETLHIVADITNASREQSRATADIAISLDHIRSTTSHTAATIDDIAHSTVELHNLTENLQNLVRRFAILSEDKTQPHRPARHHHRENFGHSSVIRATPIAEPIRSMAERSEAAR